MPSSYEMQNYYPRDVDDDRTRYENVKDSKSIGSAYDRYLQNAVCFFSNPIYCCFVTPVYLLIYSSFL